MVPFTGAGPTGSPTTWIQTTPDATGTIDNLSGGAPLSFDVSAEIDPVKGLPLTFAIDYKHKATQELDGRRHLVEGTHAHRGRRCSQTPTRSGPLHLSPSRTQAKQTLTTRTR